jgi:ATP-dependent helicase/DNAse subunit B
VKFGLDKTKCKLPPLKIETENAVYYVQGKIDRIDAKKKADGEKEQVVLWDYKTGQVSADIAQIFYGKKIQLQTYINAVNESENAVTTAALYMPLHDNNKKDNFVPVGQILTGNEYEIMPSIDGESVKKNVFSEEKFQKLNGYVKDVITVALDEIGNGYAARRPLRCGESSPCNKFCPYRSVCSTEYEIISFRDEIKVTDKEKKEKDENKKTKGGKKK